MEVLWISVYTYFTNKCILKFSNTANPIFTLIVFNKIIIKSIYIDLS